MATEQFTILLVDDRPENLMSLEEMLGNENRIFIKANSGNDALKALLKHPEIGLILLDVQMPEIDGFEVARLLKMNPKTKDISIIFVTAISKEDKYVLKGFDEGAVDYLYKPLEVDVTRAKVKVFEQLYHYQRQLKQTAEDLTQVNKQLERFTYVVSHDLKSPLASLIMLLDMITKNDGIEAYPELKSQLDIACQVGYQLSDMINSILEYSRQSAGAQKIEEVDVDEMVNQVVFILGRNRNVELKTAGLPSLKTNRAKLQQVFQNLIGNAIKYNDKDSTWIEVGSAQKNEFIEFYVKDNGPGIKTTDSKRIFKLFETSGQNIGIDGGSGIGLNMLKMLVEEQGGSIWVESEEGRGSTFFFEWRK